MPGLKFSAMTSNCGHQRQEELAALGRLEVEPDAALVEVVAQEGGADLAALGIEHGRQRAPAGLAVHRVLDLDHLGAEAGQQLGGVGERLHLLDGEDAHAVERLAPRGGFGVGGLPEAHGGDRRTSGPHA